MKKEFSAFLCLLATLFFASCSDLSVSDNEAATASFPEDFDWKIYAEINRDLAMSQIILDVKQQNKELGSDSVKNCVDLLRSDTAFQRNIYENYAYCHLEAWDPDGECPGVYRSRTNEAGQCRGSAYTGGCWNKGWEDLKTVLQDSLDAYSKGGRTSASGPVRMMCLFMPKTASRDEAEEYLKSYYIPDNGEITGFGSKFDSTIINKHYHVLGFADGRPYKYCNGNEGEKKTTSLADKRKGYNDYSKYKFCFNKEDNLIYTLK